MTKKAPNVLLVHPRFVNGSFWNYESTCHLVGKSYPAPPLGLITVAAMLPQHWPVKLVDRNVQDLRQADFEWADVIMLGGMLPQQEDMFALIDRAREQGIPSVVGGPDVSSQPEMYGSADFRVIGEAEGAIGDFIAAWERGDRSGEFRAPLYSVDVKLTPIPRFELLDFGKYVQVNVQFSRGCPFLCEFCDIIELFGRKPRTKDTGQMLAELDRLYELGYRGHVDFVDDNLIGNKKAIKAFLPHLVAWQKQHKYPLELSTEASLNLADDHEFLGLMRDAGFFAVFIGIESPDPDVLIATRKKQNTSRDIAANVHTVQSFGMFVLAGFIVGFDSEGEEVAQGIIDLIEKASIPVSMVGLLYALPNTQLSRRLVKEKRLFEAGANTEASCDQCTAGLNFETTRPRIDILKDYLNVIEHLYDRDNYFNRVRRSIELIDASGPCGDLFSSMLFVDARNLAVLMWNVTFKQPEMRGPMWRLLGFVLRKNPRAIKHAMYMGALYSHLGPFSRVVSAEISNNIEDVRTDPDYDLRWARVTADVQSGPMSPSAHMAGAAE